VIARRETTFWDAPRPDVVAALLVSVAVEAQPDVAAEVQPVSAAVEELLGVAVAEEPLGAAVA
jgi:hypothetical protein